MKNTMKNTMDIFDIKSWCRGKAGMNGRDVICSMFEMTDDDCSFMTYEYRADSVMEIPDGPALYTIGWRKDSPEDEIRLYESIKDAVREISSYAGEGKAVCPEDLPPALDVFYSLFLEPAEACYSEQEAAAAREDMDLIEDGHQLCDDRVFELKVYTEAVERDAARRIGSGPLAHDLVRRCQRLLRLYITGAPEIIIASEEKKLAYNVVIHYRAEPYAE